MGTAFLNSLFTLDIINPVQKGVLVFPRIFAFSFSPKLLP